MRKPAPKRALTKAQKRSVVCGGCFKEFSYLDWAEPADECKKHVETSCPKYAHPP